mgnify:FL=1
MGKAIVEGTSKLGENLGVRQGTYTVSVTPGVNAVIGEFNPLCHNIEEWLDSVDEFAYIYRWDDKTTRHLTLNKLAGPAEVWYRQ